MQKVETTVFVSESNIPKQFKKGTFSILYKNEYRFSTLDLSKLMIDASIYLRYPF
jgi:hypothetical protein